MKKAKGSVSRKSLRKQPWLLSSAIFLVAAAALYLSTSFSSDQAAEEALLSGQRVEIALDTGEVYGGITLPSNSPDQEEEITASSASQPSQSQQTEEPQSDRDVPAPVLGAMVESEADQRLAESEALLANLKEKIESELESEVDSGANPFQQVETGLAMGEVELDTSIEAEQTSQPLLTEQGELENVTQTSEENASVQLSEMNNAEAEKEVENFSQELLKERREKVTLSEDSKPIVIVIANVGLSVRTTERVLEMPVNYTIGLSPYAPDVAVWNKKAMVLGFDTLMHLPMETPDYSVDDPGPYALMSTATGEENLSRLEMLLSLGEGYKGVYSSPNENFSTNINNIRPVVAGLSDMRVPYLYGRGAGNVSLLQFAQKGDITLVTNDVTLDDKITFEAISAKLTELEKMAQQNKFAIGIARPYPLTLKTLQLWQKKLKGKNLEVVPFSALIERLKDERM